MPPNYTPWRCRGSSSLPRQRPYLQGGDASSSSLTPQTGNRGAFALHNLVVAYTHLNKAMVAEALEGSYQDSLRINKEISCGERSFNAVQSREQWVCLRPGTKKVPLQTWFHFSIWWWQNGVTRLRRHPHTQHRDAHPLHRSQPQQHRPTHARGNIE